jgi:hypothetical protein
MSKCVNHYGKDCNYPDPTCCYVWFEKECFWALCGYGPEEDIYPWWPESP